jgi:outer membrane protein
MRFSRYILALLFITGSIISRAQQTDTTNLLTLQKVLDIAVKNNLQVKQSLTNEELAHINLRQSKENLLPSISGTAGRSFSQGRGISTVTNTYVNQSATNDQYTLQGQLTLFNGLALQNAVKSASLAYQAGKMDFQAAKDAVTVNVITAYLAILDNQELLNASKSQFAVSKENVDRSKILEQQGANKAASDFTDFQGQLSSAQVQLINVQNSLDASKLNLFQLMNVPYNPNVEFQGLNAQDLTGNYGTDPETIYQTALQQLAAVKAATLRRQSAQKNVSSVRGTLAPSLTLGGQLYTSYSNTATGPSKTDSTIQQNIPYRQQIKDNYAPSFGLNLNVPIFTNGIRRNNLARAKVNLIAAQDIEDNTKIVVRQNIEQAYYNMVAAYKKYQALNDQVKAYTESYRIYKLRFDSGVLTSVDFIIAKNNLDAATVNLISARYDYFIDSKILDYYQGKLSF